MALHRNFHAVVLGTLGALGAAIVAPGAEAAPVPLETTGQMRFVSDAPMEKIFGTGDGKGSFVVDFEDLTRTSGKIAVPVRSLQTGNAQRDEHLTGADWLDAARFPDIVFTVTAVAVKRQETTNGVTEAALEITGDFAMHGVVVRVVAPVTVKRKAEKVKVSTAFKLALADFHVKGRDGAVGNKVGTLIDVTAELKGTLP